MSTSEFMAAPRLNNHGVALSSRASEERRRQFTREEHGNVKKMAKKHGKMGSNEFISLKFK